MMKMKLLSIAALLVTLWAQKATAHQVPVLEVEAEFDSQRGATLRVNVDPRLFLSPEPTTLPPVPASWYLEQSPQDKAKTADQTRAYLAKTLTFLVGAKKWEPTWEVVAIDSLSCFPLSASSAETHLLARFTGSLPAAPGDFHLALDSKCAVPLILITSTQGSDDRRPDSVFPGETSHAFTLPPLASSAPAPPPPAVRVPTPVRKTVLGLPNPWWNRLALALFFGLGLLRHWRWAGLGLLLFHVTRMSTIVVADRGWLPAGQIWLSVSFGLLLLGLSRNLRQSSRPPAHSYASFAALGFCHALGYFGVATETGRLCAWCQSWIYLGHQLVEILLAAAVLLSVRRIFTPSRSQAAA